MWHLPIPYKLLLESNPQKDNAFLCIDYSLPYLTEYYPDFIMESKELFKQISLIDDYSYYNDLITSKHILILEHHNLYDLLFIIINSLLSECIPILFLPKGNILDFISINIPKECLIIIDKLDKSVFDEINDNMLFSQKLPKCKEFKNRFLNNELNNVKKNLSTGLKVYYIQTDKSKDYLDYLKSMIIDIPEKIPIIKSSKENILNSIQLIWDNNRNSNYIIILSDYEKIDLYKKISLKVYLNILLEYKIDCIHLYKLHDGLDILKDKEYSVAKCCYNPLNIGIPKEIEKYNRCCHYEYSNNNKTGDYSWKPGFSYLNTIVNLTILKNTVGPINTLITSYLINEYDYALRYYKKGFRCFYIY